MQGTLTESDLLIPPAAVNNYALLASTPRVVTSSKQNSREVRGDHEIVQVSCGKSDIYQLRRIFTTTTD